MQRLGTALGFNFTWVDALEADDALVGRIMERVRWQRALQAVQAEWDVPRRVGGRPDDLDMIPSQGALPNPTSSAIDPSITSPLGFQGADLWTLDSTNPLSSDFTHPLPPVQYPDTRSPIPCASPATTENGSSSVSPPHHANSNPSPNPNPDRTTQSEPWRILSRAMIACWYSHLSVLRLVAEEQHDVAIVLEDDVDMEWDLESRLKGMWGDLPQDWDLVMLGHCWSSLEGTYPALAHTSNLHPSFAPKCTHAYAVSHSGARRLVQYLRQPSFAYGRALDQAIVHLIQTDRIKSFSVYPSVVIQTKDVASDIFPGNGSRWKDTLVDSALSKIEKFQNERR